MKPAYSPIWRPNSGHPDGVTNVYISEDNEFVYFSFDITCDNTNDIGEDWFELIIEDNVFHVDDENTEYGTMGFVNTKAVSYKHQLVELQIPKIRLTQDVINFSTLFYGTVSVYYEGYTSDVDTGIQYITPTENSKIVQEIVITNSYTGKYNRDLDIDSFTITNQGNVNNNMISSVELWVDELLIRDWKIGSTVNNPDLQTGEVIGKDDNSACLSIPKNTSKTILVKIDIKDSVIDNSLYLQTKVDAVDLTTNTEISWYANPPRVFEGIETATSSTYLFSKADLKEMQALDSNENGIIDEIIVNTDYNIGPATDIKHDSDETSTLDKFSVDYDENPILLEGIEFYDSNETEASFKLTIDESDPSLSVDTSTSDFVLSYDWSNKDLWFESADSRSVPVYTIPSMLNSIIDQAGPIVTELSVSDNLITGKDVGDDFEITISFSEAMNVSMIPDLDFSPSIHQGPSPIFLFDSEYMVDEDTYQINYTIADENEYAENVDVICTTTETIDAQGVMMNSPYTETNLFTIDAKAPLIFGFPSDSITPGEDYTVRVDVTDDSDIQNVLLNYNFGSSWNTKTMNYDPGTGEYFAVVTPPEETTILTYKISAFDIHDNGKETNEKELSINDNEDVEEDEPDDEDTEGDDNTDDEPEDLDSDDDGYSDDMEESYGTNSTDDSDKPLDTDDDGTPDDDSDDEKYSGDTDDDDDGLEDEEETNVGSDPKDDEDVLTIDNKDGYLVDTDDDGEPDTYYNGVEDVVTEIETVNENTFRIDDNGDGNWNYDYDVITGSAEAYGSPDQTTESEEFPIAIIVGVIIIFLIGLGFALFKFGYIKF